MWASQLLMKTHYPVCGVLVATGAAASFAYTICTRESKITNIQGITLSWLAWNSLTVEIKASP